MIFQSLFSRQWLKTTILVIAAIAVMIRLGFWQLDRLAQRKVFNQRVEEQLSAPQLDLSGQNLDLDLFNMEYRAAVVTGRYDSEHQVVLRNQDWEGRLGVHLLTPLMINDEEKAILIDRGWVPYEDFTEGKLNQYDEPGLVELPGTIRRSQSKPLIGSRADQVPGLGEPPLRAWNWINITDIGKQIPYELLPVYLVSTSSQNEGQLPYHSQVELDLSEGPHLGYAFQWFAFAAILGIGYPIFVRKEGGFGAARSGNKTPYIRNKKTDESNLEAESQGYKQV
jgi:surfeit locus 1 family protein